MIAFAQSFQKQILSSLYTLFNLGHKTWRIF